MLPPLSIPFKSTLPEVDTLEARMFTKLGMDAETSATPVLPPPADGEESEPDAEMNALASTLMRATYHRRRFVRIVDEARARYDAHKESIVYDMIAKYIAFEAAGFLGAARSFVDGVFHVGRRREPNSVDQAGATLSQALGNDANQPGHGLPEIVFLRARRDWYDRLNLYRNVAVHVGGSESLGYYPIDSRPPNGIKPADNVMLMPDFESLQAFDIDPQTGVAKRRPRTTRPHEWKYLKNTRLESVVRDAHDGLLAYALEVGESWGGSRPTRGSGEIHDAVVLRSR